MESTLKVSLSSITFLDFISTKFLADYFSSQKSTLPSISGSSFLESSTYTSGLDRPPKSGFSSLTSPGWMSMHIYVQNGKELRYMLTQWSKYSNCAESNRWISSYFLYSNQVIKNTFNANI